jgi:N-acetylglucosaminyldiphosphoundecaprenol N-acetyl-beta-D-mannosaminyltransferase
MTTDKPLRVEVLGIPVDAVTMDGAVAFADSVIKNRKKGCYILAINPEKVILLQKDRQLLNTFVSASLLIPDGIGVVLAMRLLHGVEVKRVPGAELMPRLCELAAEKGYGVFLFGSKEEVNKSSAEKLYKIYPGLKIAGRANGYLKEEDMPGLVKQINDSGANILFVALGSPKQEQWIEKWEEKLDVNIIQGIGGTLDTIAGNVKRAPEIFCKTGLEWFYRLASDPKRAGRQKVLPVFAVKVVREKARQKAKTRCV